MVHQAQVLFILRNWENTMQTTPQEVPIAAQLCGHIEIEGFHIKDFGTLFCILPGDSETQLCKEQRMQEGWREGGE